MNKSTHIILYVVLFTSVIALYFLQFKTAENNSPKSKDSDSNPTIDSNNIRIGYVNSEDLFKNYEYAKELNTLLEKKSISAKSEIQGKYNAYQRMVQDYQKAEAIMGDREKMEKVQRIQLLEQEIYKVQQQLDSQFIEDNKKLQLQLTNKTNEYMQEIGNRLGYDYILMKDLMFYSDSTHDITSQIIDSLNKRYQTGK